MDQKKLDVTKMVEKCAYTQCYCEENVYKVLERLYLFSVISTRQHLPFAVKRMYAVFVSSYNVTEAEEKKNIWSSLVSIRCGLDDVVSWDYHVFALLQLDCEEEDAAAWFVIDFDTKLFPFMSLIPLREYMRESFERFDRRDHRLAFKSKVLMKLIPVDVYLRVFCSDRSHMVAGGKFTSPPPAHPAILEPSPLISGSKEDVSSRQDKPTSNLVSFINMSNRSIQGATVIKASEIVQWTRSLN